ncbi:MAG: hypothetical protein JNJ85_08655 [Candidatus Kapabacteria bacterium]|nr:hypothetical protein [Candidatus Kapabacteria bacterium]
MKAKTGINFFFAIIGIIVSSKLISHFDTQALTFQHPAIDSLYGITLVLSIYILFKDFIKKPQE